MTQQLKIITNMFNSGAINVGLMITLITSSFIHSMLQQQKGKEVEKLLLLVLCAPSSFFCKKELRTTQRWNFWAGLFRSALNSAVAVAVAVAAEARRRVKSQ